MSTREELLWIAKEKFQKEKSSSVAAPIVEKPSREELLAAAKEKFEAEQPGILSQIGSAALDVVAPIGQAIDSFTGAPTRAAVSKLQDDFTDIPGAVGAFYKQVGGDPELAPTGKDLARKAGLSTRPLSELAPSMYTDDPEKAKEWFKFKKGGAADWSAAGAGGLGADLATDYTNYLPIGAIAKGIAKGAVKGGAEGTKLGAKLFQKTAAGKKAAQWSEETVSPFAENLSKFVSPQRRADYAKSVDVAVKNGIDPMLLSDSTKYGADSSLSRLVRGSAQEIGGEKYLARHRAGMKAIREAFERKQLEIGQGVKGFSEADAGDILREGYQSAKKDLFDRIDFTYRTAGNQMPGMQLTKEAQAAIGWKLQPIISRAKATSLNKALSPGTRKQAKQVIEVANGIIKQGAKGSYEDLVDGLQSLGQAFETGVKGASDIPPDVKAYREMYRAVSEGLTGTVKNNLGPEVAQSLLDNNKAMTEWFRESAKLEPLLGNPKNSPEAVFRQVILSGDTNKLRSLKNVLSQKPAVLARLKSSFIENIKRLDNDDGLLFGHMRNALKNNEKNARVLKELFDPKEIAEMEELVKLGEDMGSPILNNSRTAETLNIRNPLESVKTFLSNEPIINAIRRRAEAAEVMGDVSAIDKTNAGQALLESAKKKYFDPSWGRVGAKAAQSYSVQDYQKRMDFIYVPEPLLNSLREKIRTSGLTNTEKAQILNVLNRDGKVSQKLMDEI